MPAIPRRRTKIPIIPIEFLTQMMSTNNPKKRKKRKKRMMMKKKSPALEHFQILKKSFQR